MLKIAYCRTWKKRLNTDYYLNNTEKIEVYLSSSSSCIKAETLHTQNSPQLKTLPISVSQESGQAIGYFIAMSQKGANDDVRLFMTFTISFLYLLRRKYVLFLRCHKIG